MTDPAEGSEHPGLSVGVSSKTSTPANATLPPRKPPSVLVLRGGCSTSMHGLSDLLVLHRFAATSLRWLCRLLVTLVATHIHDLYQQNLRMRLGLCVCVKQPTRHRKKKSGKGRHGIEWKEKKKVKGGEKAGEDSHATLTARHFQELMMRMINPQKNLVR